MSITIVTTCGTSLLSSGCWNLSGVHSLIGLRTQPEDKALCEAINSNVIKESMKNDPSGNTISSAFKKELWEQLGEHLDDFPAELASLRVLKESLLKRNPPTVLGRGDQIVLLHSTNLEGGFCAKVIKQVIIVHNLFPGVTVSLEGFNNLDPIDPKDFGEAVVEIWKALYRKINDPNSRDNEFVFNLTGGYKAVVMTAASLCALVNNRRLWITYLHETAPADGLFVMSFVRDRSIVDKLQIGYVDSNTDYAGGFRGPDA